MARSHSKISVIILSDGKRGHLKQSHAVASLLKEVTSQQASIETIPVHYKFKIARHFLTLATWFPFEKRGSTLLLKCFLTKEILDSILKSDAKIIISAGHGISAVNFFSSELLSAKGIAVMTPAGGRQHRYTLRIIPIHDQPKLLPNTLTTLTTPTFLSPALLKQEAEKLAASLPLSGRKMMSLFIGGHSSRYRLKMTWIPSLIEKLKWLCEHHSFDLLITTSRRTPEKVESAIKEAFSTYPHCKLLILWREDPRDCVTGMLGLSESILVTEDSISMISEAVNSGKKVIVLKMGKHSLLKRKHRRFIQILEERGYIRTATVEELKENGRIFFRDNDFSDRTRPVLHDSIRTRNTDSLKIQEALRGIL